MIDNQEFLPCPLCQCERVLLESRDRDQWGEIVCQNKECGLRLPISSVTAGTKHWNTRPSPPQPAHGGEGEASAQAEQDFIDLVAEAMNAEWGDWCGDTGCFPDDFNWKGGNGTLSFTAGKWASHVAKYILHRRKKS